MATVACKLPNGLTVTHKDITVTFAGANDPGAVAGYGMTRDIDPDWFNDWATGDGKDLPFVAQDLIFLAPNSRNAADQARDQATEPALRTGLEGIDPDKPAPGIEPTEETKKALAAKPAKA